MQGDDQQCASDIRCEQSGITQSAISGAHASSKPCMRASMSRSTSEGTTISLGSASSSTFPSGFVETPSTEAVWHHSFLSDVQPSASTIQLPVRSRLQFIQITSNDGIAPSTGRRLIRSHAAAGHGPAESHEQSLNRLRKRRAAARAKKREEQRNLPAQLSMAHQAVTDNVPDVIVSVQQIDDKRLELASLFIEAHMSGKPPSFKWPTTIPTRQIVSLIAEPSRAQSLLDPFETLPIKISTSWLNMILHHC